MYSRNIRNVAKTGMIAALYAVLTLGLSPVSYGAIQFRISELMNLLAFFSPNFAPGIIIGCFISNIFSPYGIIDMIFGTLSTVFSMYFITRSKKLLISTFYPTISSVFIASGILLANHIGLEDNNFKAMIIEFLTILFSVAIGQFVVCTVIGYPLCRFVLKKEKIVYFIKNN